MRELLFGLGFRGPVRFVLAWKDTDSEFEGWRQISPKLTQFWGKVGGWLVIVIGLLTIVWSLKQRYEPHTSILFVLGGVLIGAAYTLAGKAWSERQIWAVVPVAASLFINPLLFYLYSYAEFLMQYCQVMSFLVAWIVLCTAGVWEYREQQRTTVWRWRMSRGDFLTQEPTSEVNLVYSFWLAGFTCIMLEFIWRL